MSNKEIVRRLVDEVWNKGNLAVVDELRGPNFVHHDPNRPEVLDSAGFKDWVNATRAAFPDFHVKIEDLLEEAGKVGVRWTVTGTHKGEYMNIPATGKKVTVGGMTISRFENGKIMEDWWAYDGLGLMRQLGVMPPAKAA